MNKILIKYDGEQDNQYCASPIVEWRYDLSSLCALSGEYQSFVIFQKGDVLVAFYENSSYKIEAGTYTNEAIQELVSKIKP